MISGMTAADVRACGWAIGMTCLLIGLAMIAGWILGCVADAMRGPADVGCPWCRKPGPEDPAVLPCPCKRPCGVLWCLSDYREGGDRDGAPVAVADDEIDQWIRGYPGGDRA